ncbi:MAG TPA: NADH-quinone oxidoreductase subunit A [Thermoplasmata archaeon]|nr:NADH-quinone oxidoreductase subunit A [Thermoplasmata archaeon]
MAADLLARYFPVALFAIFCLLFPIGTFLATRFIRPHNPGPLKDLTYECGEVPEGEAMIQFHFQYYVFALIFVVFDVAAIFLLLWALSFGVVASLTAGFASIIVFIAIMFVATNYALKKEEVLYI